MKIKVKNIDLSGREKENTTVYINGEIIIDKKDRIDIQPGDVLEVKNETKSST